jgi:single-strand DNA-binding protein
MNNVSITGRLVYEPEIKELQSGKKKLPMRLAVNRNDKNKTTDFFNLQAWDTTAEFIAKYFHKGDPIEVTGRLRTDSFEKQDGTKVNEVVIVAYEVGFVLLRKSEAEKAPTAPSKEIPAPKREIPENFVKKDEPIDPSQLPFEV